MKKIYILLISVFILYILCGCGGNPLTQTVKIAVMGNQADFYPGYKEGIERAVNDLNKEYVDSGCTVEYEFYNDNGNYEKGAAIIDTLASDKSITAVIGAVDMDINKTAAHVFNEAEKLFVIPFFLYDSVYEDNYYDTVFSLCNSAKTVGDILRGAAADTKAKRWAVCAADGEFERTEMNGFLQNSAADGIAVVDCASMSMLVNQFDEVYKYWDILGVEGVVMFPSGSEGFDILKKIKKRNPDIICAGDTAFDNSVVMDNDPELLAAMNGFIMADEFMLRNEADGENSLITDMEEEYKQKTGNDFDVWYIQAYNAVRMIADTAIQNRVFNSADIAKLLHENDYNGLYQRFKCDEKGLQVTDVFKYSVMDERGYFEEYELKD